MAHQKACRDIMSSPHEAMYVLNTRGVVNTIEPHVEVDSSSLTCQSQDSTP